MLDKQTTVVSRQEETVRLWRKHGEHLRWCRTFLGALLISLLGILVPVLASGPIWLSAQQVTFSMLDKEGLSMATYRNHAYIL